MKTRYELDQFYVTFWLVVALFVLCLLMVGCKGLPYTSAPKLKIDSPLSGKMTATGDAEQPAKVEATKAETVMPIPAKSTVTRTEATSTEPASTVVVVAADTEIRTTAQTEVITQAKSFSPPSPTQIAAAAGVRWFFITGAIFAVAAAVLFYTGHLKAGVFALAGAVSVPMLGELASSRVAQLVAVACACIAGALWAAWHMMTLKQHAEVVADLKAKAYAADKV